MKISATLLVLSLASYRNSRTAAESLMTDVGQTMVLLIPQEETTGCTSAVAKLARQAIPGGGSAHVVLSALTGMLRDGTPWDEDSQRTLQDSTIALLKRALKRHLREKWRSSQWRM